MLNNALIVLIQTAIVNAMNMINSCCSTAICAVLNHKKHGIKFIAII